MFNPVRVKARAGFLHPKNVATRNLSESFTKIAAKEGVQFYR